MGNKGHNVNDNVRMNESEYNDIDNDRDKRVVKPTSHISERAMDVDRIADHLVRKFQAPNSRNFFCKCAWKLSEDDIWTAYEQSHSPKVKYPLKYFITLCQIKLSRAR